MKRKFFIIAFVLFTLHLIEELLTNFYLIDDSVRYLSLWLHLGLLTTFILTQFILFIFLVMFFLKKKKFLDFVLGTILLYEITHIIPAIQDMAYYPGFITGTLLFVFGIFYWKGLLRTYKN